MKFIVLHASSDNNPIYINVECVSSFYEWNKNSTKIYVDSEEPYNVKESCAEILDLISKQTILRLCERQGDDNV